MTKPRLGPDRLTRGRSTGRKTTAPTNPLWPRSASSSLEEWTEGNCDDREKVHDGGEPDEDGEPSLGLWETSRIRKSPWAQKQSGSMPSWTRKKCDVGL
jgi:hypothetical protein